VKIEIPFGDFFLREDTERPIICIATGAGFAPIKSIRISDQARQHAAR
jgi:CDP-4-dehydro-6-deoxyglucose reductase